MNERSHIGRGTSFAKAIGSKTLPRNDVMSRSLDAIDAREADVRAFAHLERGRFQDADSCPGPLAGLPVGIKDLIDTADMPTSYGSPIYAGHRPASDATIVGMVRRAGGTVVGKTVSTEFAAVTPGPTRNPADLAHTPGGSSSGSAAGVAAGFVPFAVGTQTAGSVIRPASFCGVAGLKPTHGLLPGCGVKGLCWTLDTVGLFAATVPDLAFFTRAVLGMQVEGTHPLMSPPRLGLLDQAVLAGIDPSMKEAMAAAVASARARGASMQTLPADEALEAAQASYVVIQDFEICRTLAFELDRHGDRVSSRLKALLEAGRAVSGERYVDALRQMRVAQQAVAYLFETVDALIVPSATGPAPRGLEDTGSAAMNRLWTLLGLPAVSVPGLRDRQGLPLGIQVVGAIGRDLETLRVAEWLEPGLAAGGGGVTGADRIPARPV